MKGVTNKQAHHLHVVFPEGRSVQSRSVQADGTSILSRIFHTIIHCNSIRLTLTKKTFVVLFISIEITGVEYYRQTSYLQKIH